MDELEKLRQYGSRANAASEVNVDVTARVLRTVRQGRTSRRPESLRPLVWVLAASWLTVLFTGFFVQEVWSQLQDPLTSLLTPFVVALQ